MANDAPMRPEIADALKRELAKPWQPEPTAADERRDFTGVQPAEDDKGPDDGRPVVLSINFTWIAEAFGWRA